jgi:hypothetical protein
LDSPGPHYITYFIDTLLNPRPTQDTPHENVNPISFKNQDVSLESLIRKSKYGPLPSNISRVELKNMLVSIYKTIFNKETTHQGLADLTVLMKCNPALQIDKYIQSTAIDVRMVVEQGLKKFEAFNVTQLRSTQNLSIKEESTVTQRAEDTKSIPLSFLSSQQIPIIKVPLADRENYSNTIDEAIKSVKEKFIQNHMDLVPPTMTFCDNNNTFISPIPARNMSIDEVSMAIASLKERVAVFRKDN